jgi:hypothetical protein
MGNAQRYNWRTVDISYLKRVFTYCRGEDGCLVGRCPCPKYPANNRFSRPDSYKSHWIGYRHVISRNTVPWVNFITTYIRGVDLLWFRLQNSYCTAWSARIPRHLWKKNLAQSLLPYHSINHNHSKFTTCLLKSPRTIYIKHLITV